ncbi:hypothetical protein [Kitasatospora sp. NPDC091207]|uniref:hypothetical protein n=1 Tax=Kitasatospora sp. NPDC091207 TaxID=3364083 RepID=UPI0037FA46D3
MLLAAVTVAITAVPLTILDPADHARAASGPAGGLNLAAATTAGIHNTYSRAAYHHLAQALDAGASLVELDTWTGPSGRWTVSHTRPAANDNNCTQAATTADLYTGSNQDLASCLDDIRIWLTAHPAHPPTMIKLELKNGFHTAAGMGPAALDTLITRHLGNLVYRPADLLNRPAGTAFPDPDTAARSGNWPSRATLAGRTPIELIPGTAERHTVPSRQWSDVAYARHLRDLASTGAIGTAQVFPAVLGAQRGDPRTRYPDQGLHPWFVVFDVDAAAYLARADTAWYDRRHYLVVTTDPHRVAPRIARTDPPPAQAAHRLAHLAAAHASFVSSDWYSLTTVLPTVLPRG